MDDKLKRLLQDEMKTEADIIMKAVNNDPQVRDAEAPDSVREKLFQQIREHEEQKRADGLSEENKELIRLGKVYKKKRKRRKYYLLVAIFVLALGGGVITTMGGPKRVFQEVKWVLGGRKQTNIDTDDERVQQQVAVTEEEAYQKIEDAFGFAPVRMYYLPQNMKFVEMHFDSNLQNAYLIYENGIETGKVITYSIYPNYRTSSVAKDIEDTLIKERCMRVAEIEIQVKEYLIEEHNISRWSVKFEHKEIQYFMNITGLTETEVNKIVENLHFY